MSYLYFHKFSENPHRTNNVVVHTEGLELTLAQKLKEQVSDAILLFCLFEQHTK